MCVCGGGGGGGMRDFHMCVRRILWIRVNVSSPGTSNILINQTLGPKIKLFG